LKEIERKEKKEEGQTNLYIKDGGTKRIYRICPIRTRNSSSLSLYLLKN
jgi:hypothetical protein